jgi:ABC-type phosphate transport system permease subunit
VCASYYRASFFAIVNLFGEFPLMKEYSAFGMVIGTFVAVFAVALFAIPTGIIAAGFQAKVVERQVRLWRKA